LKSSPRLPTQTELLLPLLTVLDERGPCTPKEAADAVAEKVGVPAEVRQATIRYRHGDGLERETNVFERRVRWTRQTALLAGLISSGKKGIWELADAGHKTLTMARPGIVYTVLTTDLGCILWGEALSTLGYIEDGSLRLLLTSPCYPLNRQREYGGWSQDNYIETFLHHIDAFRAKIMARGSLVINLGDVFAQGVPALLTYQEQIVIEMQRRGWVLCGKEVYVNPGRARTTPWCTQTRERIAVGYEMLYWWCPTCAHPYADNRAVLEPYSESFRRRYLDHGGQLVTTRSGSRQMHPGRRFARDNGGRIPYNVVIQADESSRGPYVRFCRDQGLPLQPARMPIQIARRWIKLTTMPEEIVCDPFGGSLTTAAACQELGRHFISSEKCLEYIMGGAERLRLAGGTPETHWDSIEGLQWPGPRIT
jgi:site-specific DNA-methyltransferase (cytosine-N4-specific)